MLKKQQNIIKVKKKYDAYLLKKTHTIIKKFIDNYKKLNNDQKKNITNV